MKFNGVKYKFMIDFENVVCDNKDNKGKMEVTKDDSWNHWRCRERERERERESLSLKASFFVMSIEIKKHRTLEIYILESYAFL